MRINDYVQTLKAQVDRLERPPIIIAHSMGGAVLQKYLEKYSCEKAVLLTSVPPNGVLRTTINFLTKKAYSYPAILGLNLYHLVNSPDKAKWAFFSDDLPDEELGKYSRQLCAESFAAFLDMTFFRVKTNYHTKIPMLVLAAEKDNIFTIKENQSTAKKYNADFELVQGIAHDVMLDTTWKKAASVILKWLERN